MLYGLFFFGNFTFEVMVGHCANAGVGPNVFCGFNHIDDGVNRQDDTHDADGGTDAGHERQGQEVAAHGDTGITDGSQDGDEEPGNHGANREVKAAVLHEEQGRDQDESSTAVHVDGRADRQDETRYLRMDVEALFCRSQGDRQGAGRALGEQGDGNGRSHLAEDVNRIESTEDEENRQDDEELDEVAAEDDQGVFPQGTDDDASFNLCRQLCRESQDANRQDPEQGPDEGEQDFLQTQEAFQEDSAVFCLRHECQSQTDGSRDEHDRKDIARQERLEHVVRDDRQEVVVIGDFFQFLRDAGNAGIDEVYRQVARCDPEIEDQADGSGTDRRQKRVGDGVGEDTARFFLGSQSR